MDIKLHRRVPRCYQVRGRKTDRARVNNVVRLDKPKLNGIDDAEYNGGSPVVARQDEPRGRTIQFRFLGFSTASDAAGGHL